MMSNALFGGKLQKYDLGLQRQGFDNFSFGSQNAKLFFCKMRTNKMRVLRTVFVLSKLRTCAAHAKKKS